MLTVGVVVKCGEVTPLEARTELACLGLPMPTHGRAALSIVYRAPAADTSSWRFLAGRQPLSSLCAAASCLCTNAALALAYW